MQILRATLFPDKNMAGCLAEWSKALALGASPRGRGFEPHSNHTVSGAYIFFCCERELFWALVTFILGPLSRFPVAFRDLWRAEAAQKRHPARGPAAAAPLGCLRSVAGEYEYSST